MSSRANKLCPSLHIQMESRVMLSAASNASAHSHANDFISAAQVELADRGHKVEGLELDAYAQAYKSLSSATVPGDLKAAFAGLGVQLAMLTNDQLSSADAAAGGNKVFLNESLPFTDQKDAALEEVAELAYQNVVGDFSKGDFGDAVLQRMNGLGDEAALRQLQDESVSGDAIEIQFGGEVIFAEAKKNTHADKKIDIASGIGKRFIDTKQLIMFGAGTNSEKLEQVKEFIDRFTDDDGVKATGIRVPIFFKGQRFPNGTPYDLVKDVMKYAKSKGLDVYANPAGVGSDLPNFYRKDGEDQGNQVTGSDPLDAVKYAGRLKDFIRDNPQVTHLGAFNEGGHSLAEMNAVLDELNKSTGKIPENQGGGFRQPKIPDRVKLVGPDNKLLRTTLNYIDNRGLHNSNKAKDQTKFKEVNTPGEKFLKRFDIIGAHNLFADNIGSRGGVGTVEDFTILRKWAKANGLQVWDSESQESNKNRTGAKFRAGQPPANNAEKANRITIARDAQLDGVVIYEGTRNRADFSSDDKPNV